MAAAITTFMLLPTNALMPTSVEQNYMTKNYQLLRNLRATYWILMIPVDLLSLPKTNTITTNMQILHTNLHQVCLFNIKAQLMMIFHHTNSKTSPVPQWCNQVQPKTRTGNQIIFKIKQTIWPLNIQEDRLMTMIAVLQCNSLSLFKSNITTQDLLSDKILQTMQIKGVLQIISAHPMLQILHATIVDNLATMLIDA